MGTFNPGQLAQASQPGAQRAAMMSKSELSGSMGERVILSPREEFPGDTIDLPTKFSYVDMLLCVTGEQAASSRGIGAGMVHWGLREWE
jgi:hypothetical protein